MGTAALIYLSSKSVAIRAYENAKNVTTSALTVNGSLALIPIQPVNAKRKSPRRSRRVRTSTTRINQRRIRNDQMSTVATIDQINQLIRSKQNTRRISTKISSNNKKWLSAFYSYCA